MSFKDIPGLVGYYQASQCGKIKSLLTGKILSNATTKKGYVVVNVRNSKKKFKTEYAHRLVARAWLGRSKLAINHKNGIKTDNRVINLEYVTNKQNSEHAIAKGLIKRGSNNSNAKLCEKDVTKIKALLSTTSLSQKNIGNLFGVSRSTIGEIKRGLIWRHV